VKGEKSFDFEAIEFFVRARMHEAGTRVLERALEEIGQGPLEEPPFCSQNHRPTRMQSRGLKAKTLRTILGEVPFRRSAYCCPLCGAIRYPVDELLNVASTSFSPGARRMMARQGAKACFREGAEDLAFFANLRVDAKDVERTAKSTGSVVDDWMRTQASLATLKAPQTAPKTLYVEFDGTGVPVRKSELAHSKGKGADGQAHTREVKLGCVFTQTTLDEKGKPKRDESSTTYVGAIESSVDFGYRIGAEAARCGLANAERVVVLTDGAAYNKSIVAEHFPNAVHVLDYYHATEHLSDFLREIRRQDTDGALYRELRDEIWHGRIESLIERMQTLLPRSGERRKKGMKQINYFRNNGYAMRYDEFRKQGIFIGSGVVEAGCKAVIGKRLKQSGMFWSEKGANAIIALRCCIASGRFEDFWEESA
jgi:hypothetical protein